GDELEFLPEQRNQPQRDERDGAHDVEIAAQDGGGQAEQEGFEPALRGVAGVLDLGEQHDAEGEEDRERDAETRIGLEAGGAGEREDEQRRQRARDQRADQDGGQAAASGYEEAEADAGQGGVGKGIAEQALPAQHRKAAEDARDDAEQGGADHHVLDGVVG